MLLDYLVFIVVAINTLLSVGVLSQNPKGRGNQLFALFVTFVDLWIGSNFLENEPQIVGLQNLELFLRLDFVFAIFVFLTWFYFCSVFVQSKLEQPRFRWLRETLFLVSILFTTLSFFTPFILTDVSFYDNVIHFANGILWPLYALLLLVLVGGGLILPLSGRRRTKAEGQLLQHRQIDLILLGFLVSVGNAIFVNLILQTMYPISLEVSRLGLYGMIFLVSLTAYAIVKRQLFELRLIVARAVTFLFLTVIIAVLYAAILFIGTTFLLQTTINTATIGVGIVLTTIVALSFQPLHAFTAKLTDKIFFKYRYNSAELLSKLTHIMAETVDLEYMTTKILNVLTKEMRLMKAALLIVDKHKISGIKSTGYQDHEYESQDLEALFHQRSTSDHRFIFEDLPAGQLKNLFRKLDILVAIPIRNEREEVAVLILGPKLSGEIYYQRDIDVLEVFAPEAGIAIQNAKAYAAIKKFSAELEQRVFERTAQLEEAQERELAKAREVARLKDEFVFVATHELRTPVTVIKGFLELVSEATKNFPKDVQENLNAISSASDHLNQLVNDLLEIARSEAKTMKVEVEPIDAIPIINSLAKELSPIADQKHVMIKMKIDKTTPMVLANSSKFKEVIMNLLSNAIKYNRERGTVDITVFPQGANLIMEFRDTGYGIPKKQQEQIFQKFFRASVKETQEVMGTGLGLFITRMLVEKMGGKIMFSSVEGKGTTFGVSLPIAI